MEKTFALDVKKYDGNACQEYKVTYHFVISDAGNITAIWCEYGENDSLVLTTKYESLPDPTWTYMYFHYCAYWLVTPLLYAGVIQMTRLTSFYPNKKSKHGDILVQVCAENLKNLEEFSQ